MVEVAARELRNNTREVLRRAESGEEVVITVDGKPAAILKPLQRRRRWMARDEFVARVLARPADVGLRTDLAALPPDSMGDLDS